MSLVSVFKGKGPTGFGYGSTAEDVTAGLDLSGKTILLTGCNSGIGAETMRVLAMRGATVICTARTMEKADAARADMVGETIPVVLELSEPQSVRDAVEAVRELGRPLDAIMCNAGVMAIPDLQVKHGIEMQFLTNHIGHFILVTGLLEMLTDAGRVVLTSSEAHRQAPRGGIDFDNLDGSKGYIPWIAYGRSKLSNILFAKELARRMESTPQTANAVHPGVIATNLTRHMSKFSQVTWALAEPLFLKSIPQGAATQTYVAVHPDAGKVSGEYWSDCNIKKPTRYARDPELAKRLWEKSEEIVAKL